MKKQNKKNNVVKLSPINYIRNYARKLPIHECWVDAEWNNTKMCNVMITRKHYSGEFTFGMYLVDLACLGIKDTTYYYKLYDSEYQNFLEHFRQKAELINIDYLMAHNIIFAAMEYAEELGFKPHKDFNSITKYILENDDENIEVIDIECGVDGVPTYFIGPNDTAIFQNKVINTLNKNLGEGNFDIYFPEDMDDEYEDGDYEEDLNSDSGNPYFKDDEKEEYDNFINNILYADLDTLSLKYISKQNFHTIKENFENLNIQDFEKYLMCLAYSNSLSDKINVDKIYNKIIGNFNLNNMSDDIPSILIENLNPGIQEDLIDFLDFNITENFDTLFEAIIDRIDKTHGKILQFYFLKALYSEEKKAKNIKQVLNLLPDNQKNIPLIKILNKQSDIKSSIKLFTEKIPPFVFSDFFDINEPIKYLEFYHFMNLMIPMSMTIKNIDLNMALLKILRDIGKKEDLSIKIVPMIIPLILFNIPIISEKYSE